MLQTKVSHGLLSTSPLQTLPNGQTEIRGAAIMKSSRRANVSGEEELTRAAEASPATGNGSKPAVVAHVMHALELLSDAQRLEDNCWDESGRTAMVKCLIEATDLGEEIDWDIVDTCDIVGTLKARLKTFGPLVPRNLFVKLALTETVDDMRELLRALQPENRALTRQLLLGLQRICACAANPQDLALVIAVNLLGPALVNSSPRLAFDLCHKAAKMILDGEEILRT